MGIDVVSKKILVRKNIL